MSWTAPAFADTLSAQQVEAWDRDGYLVLPDVIAPDKLSELQAVVAAWRDESRHHDAPYGETIDGRPRFDIEPSHRADRPALRRVASPIEVSDEFLDLMRTSPAADAVAQLVGPNIKHNNTKLNTKLPGAGTTVAYHQDFVFQPHSNEDLIAVLFFLDDVTLENGPLEVVPGSHRGPIHEHWHDGVFTGAVAPDIAAAGQRRAVRCTGPAGSACLMHTRLLHGSAPNVSDRQRTLFIAEYCAEDARPLDANHLPSRFEGEVVRGVQTNRVRCSSYEMAYPEYPSTASFFDQQAKQTAS